MFNSEEVLDMVSNSTWAKEERIILMSDGVVKIAEVEAGGVTPEVLRTGP
jgi:hypothetical protein